MDGAAETRTMMGGPIARPYPIRAEGLRRRPGLLTAYGWAAVCALMAITLTGVTLVLH